EPVEMARAIREKIKSETGLTASVGVAPNKFLAKFASDLDKPDGLTLLWSADVERVLWPRPITDIFGIGEASARKLHGLGVRTIGQIAAMPIETLRSALGDKTRDGQTGWADRLHERARGIDERPVVPDRHAKSVGHEQTFGENLGDPEAVRRFLLRQTEAVGRRLRAKGRAGRTVTVKIRFGDFETITRATTLDEATDRTDELWRAALATFDAWAASSFRPVRLVGVSVSGLTAASEPRQAGLFGAETDERSGRLDEAADAIAKKFGKDAITRARSLRRE
ncbi:MAG: DNA polymerase IV, partial [Planctomycetota bacterium]